MRIASDTAHLAVEPGTTASLVLDVTNTTDVIDGVSARVIGLPDTQFRCEPPLLPLFPEASGQITVAFVVPHDQPAGQQRFLIEVSSHSTHEAPQYVEVQLDVARRLSVRAAARPQVVRARRSGAFVHEVTNDGNVPLNVSVRAADSDRASRVLVSGDTQEVRPGLTVPMILRIRGPRLITGSELDRTITITTSATPADHSPDVPVEADETLVQETAVRLRQRPLVSRGLMTTLILASIIALWASAFFLGAKRVFDTERIKKSADDSFFAARHDASLSGAQPVALSDGAPAGALPKSGQLPAGLAGQITGIVRSKSEGQPVGRILVEAVRVDSKGQTHIVSSTATLTDGTYTIAGLFPTDYFLRFSAPGFVDTWVPRTPSLRADGVTVTASDIKPDVNATIAGKPSVIRGTVAPADVRTRVIARSLYGGGKVAGDVFTNGAGEYTLTGLPAPGTFELTFQAQGYQSTSIIDTVTGEEDRTEPTVQLGATEGAINGTVTVDGQPLGGATVTAQVDGKPVTVTTPTLPPIGQFSLTHLPTPGTYVITVSEPTHGSTSISVHLDAGQTRNETTIDLHAGTGTITGHVLAFDEQSGTTKPLGGVTVTVGGTSGQGGAAPTTTTLTGGDVGSFVIGGLPSPGSYTLTFTADGYAPTTVKASLGGDAARTGQAVPETSLRVSVTMTSQFGSLTGTVAAGGTGCIGATVTVTNGITKWTALSTEAGDGLVDGGFLVTGLPAGTYTVTVATPGKPSRTALVSITPQHRTTQDFSLGAC